MAKRKWVTKETILKAIKTEKLVKRHFVLPDEEDSPYSPKNKKCGVCAVGAVLRHSNFNNDQISDFGESLCFSGPVTPLYTSEVHTELDYLLDTGKYLNALSLKFEDQARKTGVGVRTKKILAKFVKDNFPAKIRLDTEL